MRMIRRITSVLAATAWRLGGGLAALPAQVISLFLVYHGSGEAVGDLYRRLLPPDGTPRRRPRRGAALVGCLLLGLPVAVAMSGTVLAMIVAVVRFVHHPLLGLLIVVAGDPVVRGGGWLQR